MLGELALKFGVPRLWDFIKERHAIWMRREEGQVKPWTDDAILQRYRFCNVYRELDRETIAIRNLWREPFAADPDLWFAMVVARLINWSPTLRDLGYPVPFNPRTFTRHLENMRHRKVFGSAYIVSTNGQPIPKPEYLAEYVLKPLWNARKHLRPRAGDRLQDFYDRLLPFNGMGTFIAAQVVADMKYADSLHHGAIDWYTFAASGPGSRRGLNRVVGVDKQMRWKEEKWHATLLALKAVIDPLVKRAGMPDLHAQDLQNCLCEFDKYERTRLGEGRPRCKFPGNL